MHVPFPLRLCTKPMTTTWLWLEQEWPSTRLSLLLNSWRKVRRRKQKKQTHVSIRVYSLSCELSVGLRCILHLSPPSVPIERINIRVIDPFTIKPLDSKTITDNARATRGRIITVEDHYYEGEGLGINILEKNNNQTWLNYFLYIFLTWSSNFQPQLQGFNSHLLHVPFLVRSDSTTDSPIDQIKYLKYMLKYKVPIHCINIQNVLIMSK